ncbi:MAG: hypothetical protein ACOCS6_04380, partial [Desulfosalsimonas sp.]
AKVSSMVLRMLFCIIASLFFELFSDCKKPENCSCKGRAGLEKARKRENAGGRLQFREPVGNILGRFETKRLKQIETIWHKN